jgi:predicted amidohydrolase YtcJ
LDVPVPCKLSSNLICGYRSSWRAYAHFLHDRAGSLEVGKLADIVVVDSNLLTVAQPDQLANAKVLMTILEENIVYEAPNM